MAAKKATKKVASKKTESKKADSKKTELKTKASKPAKVKEPKATKPSAAKASKKVADGPETQMETPSTLAMAAEKAPAKKKRMTKKQIADQSERDELTDKWAKLKELDHESKAQKYKMSETYEPNTPLEHPVFGWGFILSLNENKLEVLFESGIKMLVSNFRA